MTITLVTLNRPGWAYLVCAGLLLGDIAYFRRLRPDEAPPGGFDDVFPPDVHH